ncbi:hypothetical protein [Vibrio lentus]|uniref:hypothetical protein n=1 Tax=Vibrio lentus TaxID=136468 RepID=UPI0012FFD8A8|nr:hypothetical protein [Vibrio lentus]
MPLFKFNVSVKVDDVTMFKAPVKTPNKGGEFEPVALKGDSEEFLACLDVVFEKGDPGE